MTDLDTRLHRLRSDAVPPGPAAGDVRAAAWRRRTRRHRRVALAAVPVAALLLVVAAMAVSGDDRGQAVVTGGKPTTSHAPTATTSSVPSRSLHTIEGVTVEVTPTADLHDGQLVRVQVDGFTKITNPTIVMCSGDVSSASAVQDCDLTPLELEPGGAAGPRYSGDQEVTVRRIIRLPREATAADDQGGDFDCATEPVGCVLVVASTTLPATGVGVPVSFATDRLQSGTMSLSTSIGLHDGQQVQIEATGLRPNTTYGITQCGAGQDSGCDELTWPSAKSDSTGRLRATYPVHAAIYGWTGRTDCTTDACVVALRESGGDRVAGNHVRFAPGVVAPAPALDISPVGPYREDQQVTLEGKGFPPGYDISSNIGMCPADKDTAVEERCGYSSLASGPVVVDGQGAFTTTYRLTDSPCTGPAGCVLGWVITHGPTLAKVPIAFR